jgi:hypothetical protein
VLLIARALNSVLPLRRLTQRRQECSGSAETLKKMETEFDWIVREKDNLGRGE